MSDDMYLNESIRNSSKQININKNAIKLLEDLNNPDEFEKASEYLKAVQKCESGIGSGING